MYNPLTALIWGLVIIISVLIFFWPRLGLMARYQKIRQGNIRILVEDALKYLYECERNQIPCTQKSLADSLSISLVKATRILKQLEATGQVKFEKSALLLTSEGRIYALRMIRIHRLWEQYLAEQTGLPETAWHAEADIHEHQVSNEQAEEISQLLGNPRYDPHGDPIPSASGHLPPKRGIPLQQLNEHAAAEVVHIEDEPEEIYADILDRGIHPGTKLIKTGGSQEGVILQIEGRTVDLPQMLIKNISVRKIPPKTIVEGRHDSLDQLKVGEKAEIIGLSRACRGHQRRRLMDLGVIPGTIVIPEIESLGRDPRAYRIRGALIALRKDQAQYIYIRKMKEVA